MVNLTVLADVRQTIRGIARAPLFTAAVILLLALGIGANNLIFTAVDVLLLRPLTVPHPEQLVRFGTQLPPAYVSYDQPYLYGRILRDRARSFSDVFVEWPMEMSLGSANRLESITGETVSGNYFSALGLTAHLGRVFNDDDERADAQVAVLSYSFWKRAFGGRKDIIGETIHLRGNRFQIIGVLRPGFVDLDLETRPDVRVPMSAWKLWTTKSDNTFALSRVYMRLRPGVSAPQAESEVRTLYPAMLEAFFSGPGQKMPAASAIQEQVQARPPAVLSIERGVSAMRTQFASAVGALMAAVGGLLLLICANTGGLLLARGGARRQETAIRLSLGAPRSAMVWRMFIESLLMSGMGTIGGWFIARFCGPFLMHFLPARRPLGFELVPDLRVLAFSAGICVFTAVLISIMPALDAARSDPAAIIGRQAGHVSRSRMARLLTAFQVALATLVVVGSFALVRTLEAIRAADPGFRRNNLIVLSINPRMAGVKSAQIPAVFDELVRRAQSLRNVENVSLADRALMRGIGIKVTVGATGARITRADTLNASINSVGLGHFANMGMHILRGRDFGSTDNGGKPRPAIVSESFVRKFFPHVDPVGRTFGMGGAGDVVGPGYQVVGIVNDAKYRTMREDPPPTIYALLDIDAVRFSDGMTLHVSVRGEPGPVVQGLQTILRTVGPGLAATSIATMEQEIETSLWQERLLAALSTVFGSLATVLAGIGLLGMLSYAISRRTREIGIRMAIGATVGRIAAMIARDAARTVLPGVLVGLCAYAACARLIGALLYGVSPWDVTSLAGAAAFVVAVGAIATFIPALRAARIEPWDALRQE